MRHGSTIPLHSETSQRRTVTVTLCAAKEKVPSAQIIVHFRGQLLLQREKKQTWRQSAERLVYLSKMCDIQIRKVNKLCKREKSLNKLGLCLPV